MLWNLGMGWAVLAGGTVFGISYMLALMMESSIGREGYGPFTNATIISAGFFGTIYYANTQGINLSELQDALMYGGAGALGLLLLTFLLRALATRLI